MAYRVIKWVKGIPYEYEQRSFRIGGQVRTESVYIGPVSGRSDTASMASGNTQQTHSDNQTALPVFSHHSDTPAASMLDRSEPSTNKSDNTSTLVRLSKRKKLSLQNLASTAPLSIKVKLDKYRISELGLQTEHARMAAKMRQSGLAALPEVRIEYGTFGHHKKLTGDVYSITVPRFGKVNREKLRTEYRKATARAILDGIAQIKPETFERLTYAFDSSYRMTQKALTSFLLNTDDPGKWRKALALKIFGYMNPVANGKLEANSLGIVEYGERKDWQSEFCSLYAEIQKKGFATFRDDIRKQITQARRAETIAIRKKTIWRSARRRAIKRAQARIQANAEILHKLYLMQSLVGL